MANSVEVDKPIRVLTGGSSHVERALQFCIDSGRDQHKVGLDYNVSVTWVEKGVSRFKVLLMVMHLVIGSSGLLGSMLP